ncbi:MAG: alpha/beta fold hydrolase, partial [Verrucomicrobiota bacterium]
ELTAVKSCRTVEQLVALLPGKGGWASSPTIDGQDGRPTIQFPELVHLNGVTEGRPIFWLHGALGDVEIYHELASHCDRPFYGIQARGWMTDRAPLHGIEAMASYYVHILLSVQPDGPIDLGGFSLGGLLAYEVARQLQDLGREVSSLVMLDSLQPVESAPIEASTRAKNCMLQVVNMSLKAMSSETEMAYIHRDEVDVDQSESGFMKQLVALAKKRGLKKSQAQLKALFEKMTEIHQAFEVERYRIRPLPDPEAVSGVYFRNAGGTFFGDLEPYYLIHENESFLKDTDYWSDWLKHAPGLELLDVDAPNHVMMMSAPEAKQTILARCRTLYQ